MRTRQFRRRVEACSSPVARATYNETERTGLRRGCFSSNLDWDARDGDGGCGTLMWDNVVVGALGLGPATSEAEIGGEGGEVGRETKSLGRGFFLP